MITSGPNGEQFCCEGNMNLTNAFNVLLEIHQKKLSYVMWESQCTRHIMQKEFDVEAELWTIRALIKDCPWCKKKE